MRLKIWYAKLKIKSLERAMPIFQKEYERKLEKYHKRQQENLDEFLICWVIKGEKWHK